MSAKVKVRYSRTATVHVDPALLRERRILLPEEKDSIADAYKVLRTQVFQRMRATGWKPLGVISAGDGNGKNLTGIDLAISLAGGVNQTVLFATVSGPFHR